MPAGFSARNHSYTAGVPPRGSKSALIISTPVSIGAGRGILTQANGRFSHAATEGARGVAQELRVVGGERAIVAVSPQIEPPPATTLVRSDDPKLVAGSEPLETLAPALRARKIAIGHVAQSTYVAAAARQGNAIVGLAHAGVVELKARKLTDVIGLRDPGVGDQRLRIHQRRAPTLKTDRPLQLPDHLATQRIDVLTGVGEQLKPLTTARACTLSCHARQH